MTCNNQNQNINNNFNVNNVEEEARANDEGGWNDANEENPNETQNDRMNDVENPNPNESTVVLVLPNPREPQNTYQNISDEYLHGIEITDYDTKLIYFEFL